MIIKSDLQKKPIFIALLLITSALVFSPIRVSEAATIGDLLIGGTLCNLNTPSDSSGVVPAFNGICSTLITGTEAEQKQLQKTLSPTHIFAMSDLGFANAKYQVNNIRKRIVSLRLGRKGFYSFGLLDLDFYQPTNGTDASKVAFNDTLNLHNAHGGAAGADVQLGSKRLGYFVGGNLGVGHKSLTDLEDAYDYNALGLTGGIDYRVAKYAIIGAALGYNYSNLDIQGYNGNPGGDIDDSAFSLSLYGTAFTKVDFYIDTIVTYNSHGYDVARVVDYSTSIKPAMETSNSSPDSDTLTISAEFGYEFFARRGFTIVGLIRGEYYRNNISEHDENNADTSLHIDSFSSEELNTQIGAQFTYAMTGFGGIVIPQLDIVWVDERINDINSVDSYLLNDPTQSTFTSTANEPDPRYWKWGVGATSILSAGKIIYLYFESTVDKDYVSDYNTSLGIRMEFH